MITRNYQVLTNTDCNLACSYCYEHRNGRVNTIEDIKAFLLHCFSVEPADVGFRGIDFIGGESLLYPDLLSEVIEFVLEHNQVTGFAGQTNFSLSTNGTVLGSEKVRAFLMKYKGILDVGVSIDGARDQHDKHRVFVSGLPTYDVIMENMGWLIASYPNHKLSVKATFRLEDIAGCDVLSDSWIHILKLGINRFSGNIVYEDIVDESYTGELLAQFIKVIDYMFDHGNVQKLDVNPVMFTLFSGRTTPLKNLKHLCNPPVAQKNFCGGAREMQCLGMDQKVYGCNRFATQVNAVETGRLVDGTVEQVNQEFVDEVVNQHTMWPEECMECKLKYFCPSCVAAPYDYDQPVVDTLALKVSCGWTHASYLAKIYYELRRLQKDI